MKTKRGKRIISKFLVFALLVSLLYNLPTKVVLAVTDTTYTTKVVAGNGTYGYSGDGGLATSAELAGAISIFIDSANNIYISDHDKHCIRKVDANTGYINTIAGNGTSGYSGDGGPATSAQLNYPNGITMDSIGNIYIVEGNNGCIRKVDATTGNISTVNLNGVSQLFCPFGEVLDGEGNIYIYIRKECSSYKKSKFN